MISRKENSYQKNGKEIKEKFPKKGYSSLFPFSLRYILPIGLVFCDGKTTCVPYQSSGSKSGVTFRTSSNDL